MRVAVCVVFTRPEKTLAKWVGAAYEHPAGCDYSLLVVDRSRDGEIAALGRHLGSLEPHHIASIHVPDSVLPQDRSLAVGGYRLGWQWMEAEHWDMDNDYILFVREDALPCAANWLGGMVDAMDASTVLSPFVKSVDPSGDAKRIDPAVIGASVEAWDIVAGVARDVAPMPGNLGKGGPVAGERTVAVELGKRVARAAMRVVSRKAHRELWHVSGDYGATLDTMLYETADR